MTVSAALANTTADNSEPVSNPNRRAPAAVAVCVFALLIFSSSTDFVTAAWAIQSFQIGVFALLAVYLLTGLKGRNEPLGGWAQWLLYLTPVWGVSQLFMHTTVSSFETREACLKWGALCGIFFLGRTIASNRTTRRTFLTCFVVFATAMAVLRHVQILTSGSRALSILSVGYKHAYGTFPYREGYTAFVEIVLPIALWRAIRKPLRSWPYVLASGILCSSVIISASGVGTILCSVEFVAILVVGLVKFRDPHTGLPKRSTAFVLGIIILVATALVFTVGWRSVWHRYEMDDSPWMNAELPRSALEMAKHRPMTGFGLGTFPDVYPRYTDTHFGGVVHAQNDWAEFAAEGGVPFLLLVLIPFVAAFPSAVRHSWGLGLIAIMLHGLVDHPLSDVGVSAWAFALLGLLSFTRTSDSEAPPAHTSAVEEESASAEPVLPDYSVSTSIPESACTSDSG